MPEIETEVVKEVHVVIGEKKYEADALQQFLIQLATATDEKPLRHQEQFGYVLNRIEDEGIVEQTYDGHWVVASRSDLHRLMEDVNRQIADAQEN